MEYLKMVIISLALLVSFIPASFAQRDIERQYDYFVLTNMVELDQANTRVGVLGKSYLAKVDPVSGKVNIIGTTGFINCSGLDFNPEGALYATCQRPGDVNTPVLVHLDPATGTGEEIGETGITEKIADITVTPAGRIFSYEELGGPHNFHEHDRAAGAANFIGNPGLGGQGNAVFAWGDPAAMKLVTWKDGVNQVHELNTDTAQPKFITNLEVIDNTGLPMDAGPCLFIGADGFRTLDAGGAVIAKEIASGDSTARGPIAGVPYQAAAVIEMQFDGEDEAGLTRLEGQANKALAFIDLDAGVAVVKTYLETGFYTEGLAIRMIGPRPIPTLSEWGLIATAVILFGCGIYFIVRRNKVLGAE